MAGPSFLELLGTAMRAVGTTSTLALAGAYLRRQGAMTPQVAKGLSKVRRPPRNASRRAPADCALRLRPRF
jgi:hypothetical protein